MPCFTLAIEYLTGYAIATDPANREKPEWPPHPARVFMALAAAHFETEGPPDRKQSERAALEWLAFLDPPQLWAPEHTSRSVVTVYVPVNDQPDSRALVKRSKQPRTFPRVHVGNEPLRLTWHYSDDSADNHFDGLESVCRNVTRIGHSSSLVWVRLERDSSCKPTHVPNPHGLGARMRITQAGALNRLEETFNRSAVDDYADLQEKVTSAKGKEKKQLQAKIAERYPHGQPTSQRPVFPISTGYQPVAQATADKAHSTFDPDFIVLRESEHATQSFGLESTAMITDCLRKLIMSKSGMQPVPPWVGGHEPNGELLKSQSHMALIPLSFVGADYADGHLMGVGIVLPRDLPFRERASVLSGILFDEQNQPRTLELKLGRAGVWQLVRDTDLSQKLTLRTQTYTNSSRSWASVTPVLLDRMPKVDRAKDPTGWREEVGQIVSRSCAHCGLPEPVRVRAEKTPFFRGSLRAMPGQGGFPQLRKGKFQVHIQVDFDRPVQGPILLGAGRFRGYGLMRPWKSGEAQ